MIEWGIEEIEKWNLPSVVMATQAGYGLYLECGYKPQEVWQVDLPQWGGEGTYMKAIMTRYPKGWEVSDQRKQVLASMQ